MENRRDEVGRLVGGELSEDDLRLEVDLRPRRLEHFVGQERVVGNLSVYLEAARRRGKPLDHVLLAGPPGLGKTSLAYIIAEELGSRVRTISGPAVDRSAELAAILSHLEPGEVLFIDEIHRLGSAVEEVLYPAMEDASVDMTLGQGAGARTVRMELPPFTLVGATTRSGLLTAPLRDRFGIQERLGFYSEVELMEILRRAAMRLDVDLDADASREVASRSRGTPRVALRLLRRLRDFADVEGGGKVSLSLSRDALSRLGVDELGLDELDRRLLRTLIEHYAGGPAGLNTLAASLGEESDTLEEVSEPFLIQIGFIERTPRGRVATLRAREHLDLGPTGPAGLFER